MLRNKIYCKLTLEVQAVNVGKRLEARVTAMRSKLHLTSDIFEEIYFIKSSNSAIKHCIMRKFLQRQNK